MPGWLKWGGIGCLGLIALVVVLPLLGSMFANSFWTFVVCFVLMCVVAVLAAGNEGNAEASEGRDQQLRQGEPSNLATAVFGILFVAVLVFGVTATGKAIGRVVTGGPETASDTTAQTARKESKAASTAKRVEKPPEEDPGGNPEAEEKPEVKPEQKPEQKQEDERSEDGRQERAVARPEPRPQSEPQPEPEPESEGSLAGRGTVVTVSRAVDGDTVEVSPAVNGIEDVRLIGLDTPESSSDCGTQPLADEAAAFTESSLVGRDVALEVGTERVDQYGRLLAYVWTGGDSMFNEALLREGLAQVYMVPPNDEYEARFYDAQDQAASAGLGIWGLSYERQLLQNDRGNGVGGGCAAEQETPQTSSAPSGDLYDCSDFDDRAEAQAQLLPGDPYGLDADGDGVACDSLPGGSSAPAREASPQPSSASASASPAGKAPSPPPPDVDCSDFPGLGNPQDWYFEGDPHRLDADDDGQACEPY